MSIPKYETIMLPLLRLCADGKEHALPDVVATLGDEFKLTDEEREERTSVGKQRVFYNRVSWARTYLKAALLLEGTEHGKFRITARGADELKSNPLIIDNEYLKKFPEFGDFLKPANPALSKDTPKVENAQTPLEAIGLLREEHNNALAVDLLDKLKSLGDAQFERIAVQLVERILHGKGYLTPISNDKGVDGFVFQDYLGLDKVLVQAKNWNVVVGRPIIQKFVGSMEQHKGLKGVIVTSSHFAKSANDYVLQVGKTVVLIDGSKLAALMIEYGVGLKPVDTIILHQIDNDFFERL